MRNGSEILEFDRMSRIARAVSGRGSWQSLYPSLSLQRKPQGCEERRPWAAKTVDSCTAGIESDTSVNWQVSWGT